MSIRTLFTIFVISFSSLMAKEPSHYVLVSVAPHKFFVEQIAGDTVNVGLMVPAGASAHTFEPTPRQMLAASQADAWFILGEHFENRAIRVLKGHNPKIEIVDLRNGIDMIIDPQHGGCCHGGADPHIWLSPKIAPRQAATIAEALGNLYPENKELYQKNLQTFNQQLAELDKQVGENLVGMNPRVFMVSHPAYAYLARDYGLTQLSIEFEGKDPKPQQLTRVLQQARAADIQTVFIQPQYSSKGANLIAKELGASVVDLNPYSEDYINSLHEITKALAKSRNNQA